MLVSYLVFTESSINDQNLNGVRLPKFNKIKSIGSECGEMHFHWLKLGHQAIEYFEKGIEEMSAEVYSLEYTFDPHILNSHLFHKHLLAYFHGYNHTRVDYWFLFHKLFFELLFL